MAKERLLAPDIEAARGRQAPDQVIVAERRLVERLLDAIGDPDSRWQREVPPTFLLTWMMSGGRTSPSFPEAINWLFSDGERPAPSPFTGLLDGGGEWEFLRPILPGDTITSTLRLAEIKEREGRLGRMLLVTWESHHSNQHGHLVAVSRGTLVAY